ncbi:MAG: flagellar hook-length control protein FliK [Treponema sp.]|nr:flagellar hook-length control protein FliK [Treponema sp.]
MELTEILVAVKQPDFQNATSLQEPVREYSRNGKSFSELLAGINSENQTASSKEDVKIADAAEKTPENDSKVTSAKDSKNEKTEKVDEKASESVKSEEKSRKTEVAETESEENDRKSELFAYSRLNLVVEENIESVSEETNLEIGKVSGELLDRIADQGDAERIALLSKGKNLEVSDDFEFEIVSDETLALESAQKESVENPLEFLATAEKLQSENETGFVSENVTAKEESSFDKLKSKINVTDLRTEKEPVEKTVLDNAEPKMKVTMTGNDSATIEMNLQSAQGNISESVLSSNAQVAASDGSNFQAMLNNQIQANASEIVQTGNIILKDNNKGTINLVLHPDDIGSVKMTLSLDGDKITGHIAVNTKEALEVFKNNAESLREAFMKNGYENASFEVSYNSSGNSSGQQFAEQEQQNQNAFYGRREYASLDEALPVESSDFSEDSSRILNFGINIVA